MGNTNDKGSLQNPRPLPVTPSRYEEVLKLDEEESWIERCAVITRPDHEEYVRCAQDILVDLIENLPVEVTPEKPDRLEIHSLETHSVSSADFTPSESSFDTAREELLSISLLPDLLQPETLHDWRLDSDRSDTDYESATDSGEAVAVTPAPDEFLLSNASFSQDQFSDDRETTPVPQLLTDNQPQVVNRSFNCDPDREKTPVPANVSGLLPDLASESFTIYEAGSLVEELFLQDSTAASVAEALEDTGVECSASAANLAEAFNTGILNSNSFIVANETTTNSSEQVVVVNAVKENAVAGSFSPVEGDKNNVEALVVAKEGEVEPQCLNLPNQIELNDTSFAETEVSTSLLENTLVEVVCIGELPATGTNLVEPGALTSPIEFSNAVKVETTNSDICCDILNVNSDTITESDVGDVIAPKCCAEDSVEENSDVYIKSIVEQLVESVHLNELESTFTKLPESSAHIVSVLNDILAVEPSIEDLTCTVHEGFEKSVSQVPQDLQAVEELKSTEPHPADLVADLQESSVDNHLNRTFELSAKEPELLSVELAHAIPIPIPASTETDTAGVCLNTSTVVDQLESTFVVEPASVPPLSVDSGIGAETAQNSSACVEKLESTFLVDSATVENAADQYPTVRDNSQEASADIQQLLERAARVVAELRDIVPEGSEVVNYIRTSSKPNFGFVEPARTLQVEGEAVPIENHIDSSVTESSSEVERLETHFNTATWQNSVENQVECEYSVSSDSKVDNTVDPPTFDLDQCLELEATIIAAELINLSLREGEEGETDQIMKEKKMADLENNESSRVVGDVAPGLDENVNPFQSKPRVVSSPMRGPNANGDTPGEALKTPILGSKGLKNGEVAPKVASPGTRTPTRKTSSPSSRTTPLSNSPKRKGCSSLESGLAEGERENGVGSPFTPSSRLGRSPPRTPARDSNTRKAPVKANGSPPKEGHPMVAGKPPTPGSIDGSGEGFTRCAPEGAPAQAEHNPEAAMTDEFKRPLPKPAPRVKSSDCCEGSPGASVVGGAGPPTNGAASLEGGNQMMVRSVEDRVNSEAGPDVAEFADGEFRSAVDVFKDPGAFEFLQMAGNKQLSESALARMSLYVKFDPLLKAISPVARRSLSKGSTSDHSQTSSMSEPSGDDLLLGTPSKSEPMLDLSSTPGKGDGCSEGRLLDLTPFKSKDGQIIGHQYSEEEFAQALRMQELLFQEQLITKDREWDERTRRQEKDHELTTGQLIADNERLVHEFQKLQESHQQMTQIVSEYERTISQLITDRESEKLATDERASMLKKERDQALEDLQSVEGAFADLHRRYEKSKVAVDGFKKNEEVLKTYVAEGQAKVKKQEQKYELLKHHAEEKLECANAEIDSLRRSSEAELAALRAQLKKSEMKVNGLERSLETKTKENAELTNICDELIAKVGHGNS